jgi:hypothetical protein
MDKSHEKSFVVGFDTTWDEDDISHRPPRYLYSTQKTMHMLLLFLAKQVFHLAII